MKRIHVNKPNTHSTNKTLSAVSQSQFRNNCVLMFVCLSFISQFSGCHTTDVCCSNRSGISQEIESRMQKSIGPATRYDESVFPPGVVLEDGITKEESVAIALWNNASFQETLTQLGMAKGDLIQAGLLTNPQLTTFLPIGPKQWEWTLYMPIEALILRKQKIRLAETECHRVGNELVQNGLNLIRDVRIAHANCQNAVEQSNLATEFITVRKRIAHIANKRLKAGDISELESATAQIDVARSQRDAARLQKNIDIAKNQLAMLMGVNHLQFTIATDNIQNELNHSLEYNLETLLSDALESRPDLMAASIAITSAQQRAKLSKWAWLRFDITADANSRGRKGYESGPGIRMDLPIFNRNEGGIVRANAEVNRAAQRYAAVKNQVTLDVKNSRLQLIQASENLNALNTKIIPSLKDAMKIAEKAFAGGGTSYLLVLQTNDRYLTAKTEELDVKLAQRRAKAELERSVGRKIDDTPQNIENVVPAAPTVDNSEPKIKQVQFSNNNTTETPQLHKTSKDKISEIKTSHQSAIQSEKHNSRNRLISMSEMQKKTGLDNKFHLPSSQTRKTPDEAIHKLSP